MYNGYLDKCMPSEIMRNHLKKQELSEWEAMRIIVGAPVSIYIKLDELQKLVDDLNRNSGKNDFEHECVKALKRIELALGYLDMEGIFTVEEVNFDYTLKEPKWGLKTVCGTIEAVYVFIRGEFESRKPDPEECRWYDVSKWIKGDSGQYRQISNYGIVENEIIYADLGNDYLEKNDDVDCLGFFNTYYMGDMHIPVPFKAGDILEVDGYPYGPKFRMILLEVGNNVDCCDIQGLARDEEGRWNYGAVTHGEVSWDYMPKTPILFSAKLYEGELSEDEKLLYKVQDCIAGDDEKGWKLGSKIDKIRKKNPDKYATERYLRGLTDEELCEAMELMNKQY